MRINKEQQNNKIPGGNGVAQTTAVRESSSNSENKFTNDLQNPPLMSSNMAPEAISQANTTFIEQRVTNMQHGQMSTDTIVRNPAVESEIADGQWHARMQLCKPVLLGSYPWSTSQVADSSIAQFDFPEVLTTFESLMSRTLSMYAYFKMSPVFRFQLNSTQFHQGQLICSFDPFCQAINAYGAVPDNRPKYSRYYATGLPHVRIMASESNPVELHIPFIHPKNLLTTNSSGTFDIMGRVRVSVMNQLQAATGASTTLSLSVWLYADDASVHVPIAYHDLLIPTLETFPTGLFNTLTSAVKHGTGIAGNILTGNFGQAMRQGQGLVDDAGEAFNFDYPSEPISPQKCIMPVENMAVGKGVSRSQRLAIDPMSGHIDDIAFSPMSADMDLMKIAQTPMMFNQLSWDTTLATGSLLTQVEITPTSFSYNIIENMFQPTYLYYVSTAFSYWRGSIVLDLEFVATHFHSGKLLVVFNPNLGTPASFADQAAANPSIVVDLQQTSMVSFTVPFVSSAPLKSVSAGTSSDENTVGTVGIYVLNPLAAATNVASNVAINMYVRAGKDYELLVPRPVYLSQYQRPVPTTFATSVSGVKLESERFGDDSLQPSFSMGSPLIQPRPRFGESYTLLDLLRRFTPWLTFDVTLANGREGAAPPYTLTVSPLLKTQDPTEVSYDMSSSYLAYFSQLFSVWSGSIRYKFITREPRTSQGSITIAHVPGGSSLQELANLITSSTSYYESLVSGLGLVRTNLAQDNSIEIEVPFYTPYNMLLVRYPSEPDLTSFPLDSGSLLVSYINFNDLTSINASVYVAAGEDFRLGFLRPPPLYNNSSIPGSNV